MSPEKQLPKFIDEAMRDRAEFIEEQFGRAAEDPGMSPEEEIRNALFVANSHIDVGNAFSALAILIVGRDHAVISSRQWKHEADKYRRRTNAAEAERDRLREALREIAKVGVVFDAKGSASKRINALARAALAADTPRRVLHQTEKRSATENPAGSPRLFKAPEPPA